MGVLEKLPTFLTVCVLVMIFACLKRHTRSPRLTLWSVGWTLMFTHFLAQLLEPIGAQATSLLKAADNGALHLSAVAFLVSVSSVVNDRFRRSVLLVGLAVPFVSYAVLDAFNLSARWPYTFCVIAIFAAAAGFAGWAKCRFDLYPGAVVFFCGLVCACALRAVFQGSFQEGAAILLSLGFALSGVFMCRNYWALTPAVLTIAGGFFCWAAVFPILGHSFSRGVMLPNALWDTPKLFVALGMILAVVEDKSHAIVGMEHKAGELQRQLEHFSALSSRLLTSAAPETICPEIASAITELTRFRAVAIHIDQANGSLRMVGASGLAEDSLQALEHRTHGWTSAHIKSLCSRAQRIGNGSFLWPANEPWLAVGQLASSSGDQERTQELLIPLLSASGMCLGSVVLIAPADENSISLEELVRIESLAADLTVAVELKSLHTQLVCSEKLAAMGQLVAGVAHELNNPLTAIMGFGELISDAVTCKTANDRLQRLMSETRRMKRITDNLLRFSRQSSADLNVAQLASVVQEVLALCEYNTRKAKVTIETEVPANLPVLAISEDETKQVLLNLFNNSCDALQDSSSPKTIKIRAYLLGTRAIIEVEDNGPGFSNLSRALDPFFTTKPVGKGTGLGLSICCGIAKRRGGELKIENVTPHGGRVTLEVPIAQALPSSLRFVSAHA